MEMITEFKASYADGVLTTTTTYDDGWTDTCTHTVNDSVTDGELMLHLRLNLESTASVRKSHLETT